MWLGLLQNYRHTYIGNNLEFMAAIREPWIDTDLDDDKLRILLKKYFFGYLNCDITWDAIRE
jgi:hypothetical protein